IYDNVYLEVFHLNLESSTRSSMIHDGIVVRSQDCPKVHWFYGMGKSCGHTYVLPWRLNNNSEAPVGK
uniref:Uncharacterized protein n=1 Tax=Amphimedon queenslandica TaxID=400682 RepID=A0A1X7UVV5_AMPQE